MKVRILVEHPGELTEFGYHVNKSSRARHRAIAKAVSRYGKSRIWHGLHAAYIRDENQNPDAARVFKADRNWVSRRF